MRTKQIILVALAVVLLAALTGPAFAGLTKGRGKMSGSVVDGATGQPLQGVTVKLFYPKEKQFHKPFPVTDAEGKWRIHYVAKGRWDLDFVKQGYELKKISYVVDPTIGTKNPPIDVSLLKMEGPVAGADLMNEVEKAKGFIVAGNYDKAIKEMNTLLDKFKDDPGVNIVYLYMGNSYAMKNDYQKAIEFYQKALEKFPKNKELILSIGNAYNNTSDFDNAMKWFSKLAVDDIGNVDTLYNIGVIFYNKADFAGAVNYFKKSTEIDANFADGFYQLGMTLVALDKSTEAVTALEAFLKLAPDSPNAETAKAIIDAYK